ncbi:MAG: hypothetical protein WC412_01245 [Candidatus Omnitrophota bacterium]|jgi:hypothetical protein
MLTEKMPFDMPTKQAFFPRRAAPIFLYSSIRFLKNWGWVNPVLYFKGAEGYAEK